MSTSQTGQAIGTPRPGRGAALALGIAAIVAAVGVAMALRPMLIDAMWPGAAQRWSTVTYQTLVQAMGLILAGLTLLVAYRLSAGRVARYWGVGHIAAPARRVRWLGVREGTSWRRLGLVMLVWISLLLTAFLYLGLAKDLGSVVSPVLLLCAVGFAFTNAVVEEVVFRLSVVGVLRGVVSDGWVLALGAGIFGVVHFLGVPGGPVGVLMAGFLGWFLTKSIVETSGMFWAVLIHFVQDVIIFAFLLHLA